MSDWQRLEREEQQDIIAYEISRSRDRNEDIAERLGGLQKNKAGWEGHVAALLIAIWQDLP